MKTFAQTLKAGFATFAMFFGAGNILFPLLLGQSVQDQGFFAILGLLLTAVAIPISGLIAMTNYDGDYRRFFASLGTIPGYLTATIIMLLLGPLGSTPRCIALSYATIKVSFPELSSIGFSALSCVLIYLCTMRHRRIVDLLGAILSPWLLFVLGVIVIAGIVDAPPAAEADLTALGAFGLGLTQGYYTMDLLAAFFFSSVIIRSVRRDLEGEPDIAAAVRRRTLHASWIGAALLGIVYICFSYIAAHHTSHIEGLSPDRLLGALTLHLLGPWAGIVASLTVALACLTTAIALIAVFAEFLSWYVCKEQISYHTALVISLLITFCVSTMELAGIMAFLAPVLEALYPVLIVLTFYNILRQSSKAAVEAT